MSENRLSNKKDCLRSILAFEVYFSSYVIEMQNDNFPFLEDTSTFHPKVEKVCFLLICIKPFFKVKARAPPNQKKISTTVTHAHKVFSLPLNKIE